MKILFLDVDGVLNGHERHDNGYCGIDENRVRYLDLIVERTGCRIVLASAWRYMILGGQMTLHGFGYLLSIHGAARATTDSLIGILGPDKDPSDPHDRGKLAREWLTSKRPDGFTWRDGQQFISFEPPPDGVVAALAIDDLDDPGYTANGIAFVKTYPGSGLTVQIANDVIRMLNSDKARFVKPDPEEVVCSKCGGSGGGDDPANRCRQCDGKGEA